LGPIGRAAGGCYQLFHAWILGKYGVDLHDERKIKTLCDEVERTVYSPRPGGRVHFAIANVLYYVEVVGAVVGDRSHDDFASDPLDSLISVVDEEE